MQFSSDNAESWAPEVLEALAKAAEGPLPSYGDDPLTEEVGQRFNHIFEKDVTVFLVATGTAANSLAFASLCPPYGAIFAHEAAHVMVDECGAPEFFTGGAKMVALPGDAGKIAPDTLTHALSHFFEGFVHHSQPHVLSLTQATESGTVYSPEEVAVLAKIAHGRGMAVHMDGARFANALVHLGCSPAEATWKAGVDVMSFGATKNGCLAAEAVVFFNPDGAASFPYLRKRAGHLFSKHRVLAAQMLAYLEEDRWLKLAAHANAMAARLGGELAGIEGVRLWYPVQANEVFPSFPGEVAAQLMGEGAAFHPWIVPGDPAQGQMCRLVTSFKTKDEDVDAFLTATRRLCGA
jgi:threonine aldolase